MSTARVCKSGAAGLVVVVTLLVALVAAPARAAAPPAPIERFFERPVISQVKLSPSGRQLAFVTNAKRERAGLVVMNLDGSMAVRWAAGFADADVGRFHWVNDERLVFSATDHQEGSGEEYEYAPGLYSVKADGSDFKPLVRRQGPGFITDVTHRDATLPWNHQLLAVLPGHGDEVIVGRWRHGRVTPLWLDTASGRTREMDLRGAPLGVTDWWFDPQGAPRAAIANTEKSSSVHWRGADAGWRQLAESAPDELPFVPEAVDAKGDLYLVLRHGAGQWRALGRYDAAAGRPAATHLVEAPGFDVSPELVFDSAGQRLLGVHLETDGPTTVWYDPALRALQAQVDTLLPEWANRLICARCEHADRVVLVHSSSARDPGRLWLWRPGETGRNALRLLQVARPDIPVTAMADKQFERIRARDGRDLPVWITRPAGLAPQARPPAVMLVHGGPWARGGHWHWDPMVQWLAARGYVVIEPEFRGSDGYGLDHLNAGNRQWGRAMQDDLADALKYAQAKGLAGERACIMGASYGGYATLMGLIRQPELWSCGVQWLGVADLELFLKGSWWIRDDVSERGRNYSLTKHVARLPGDAAMVAEINPVNHAALIKAPLLMAYGAEDLRVPLAHGERMRDALRKAGRDPEWVVYPGEGHGWGLDAHRIDFARRVDAFLARHLPVAGR